MAGVDLTTLKELLGHKSITMTLRYAHLAPSHKQKAVEMLDNAIINFKVKQEYEFNNLNKAGRWIG
jgi:site-specific recombinase XerC|tara:strand:+ start:869 stop:1066 length:198 start_codon:yes stop_codon:yes gene_type:complete